MKKRNLTGLLVSQLVLIYAVFIVCIESPKSKYQQVEKAVGAQKILLNDKEIKLNSIIFKYVWHPTTVTVEEVHKRNKPDSSCSEFDLLSADEAAFLMRIINEK